MQALQSDVDDLTRRLGAAEAGREKDKQEIIPAVSHMGTGRLQAVFPDTPPRYHRLIKAFGAATGVPVLMNTSFTLRGEPIVTTPENAYRTFRASEMDLLVVGNLLVRK